MDTAWAWRRPAGAGLRPEARREEPCPTPPPPPRKGGPGHPGPTPGPSPSVSPWTSWRWHPQRPLLVARALELLAERRFWAGIVFLGPEERRDRAQPRGPGHVRVKIRMDIDAVTRTNKIRDRCGRGRCGRGLGGRRV